LACCVRRCAVTRNKPVSSTERVCGGVLYFFRLTSIQRPAVLAITLNGALRQIAVDQTTVADLIRELALDGKRIAVEKNGEIVPRSRHAETPVASGDTIEIVAAVGGG